MCTSHYMYMYIYMYVRMFRCPMLPRLSSLRPPLPVPRPVPQHWSPVAAKMAGVRLRKRKDGRASDQPAPTTNSNHQLMSLKLHLLGTTIRVHAPYVHTENYMYMYNVHVHVCMLYTNTQDTHSSDTRQCPPVPEPPEETKTKRKSTAELPPPLPPADSITGLELDLQLLVHVYNQATASVFNLVNHNHYSFVIYYN